MTGGPGSSAPGSAGTTGSGGGRCGRVLYRESYYLSRQEPREGTPEHLQWQEDMDRSRHQAEVIIGKQRHGPIGNVKLSFDEDVTRFGNLARDGRFDRH